MTILLVCVAAHALAAQLLPSPWWVPDLTLIGVVLSVGRAPERWLVLSGLAGFCTMLWAVRFPIQTAMGAVALGAGMRLLTQRWDVTDRRVASLVVGVASAASTLGTLWMEQVSWSTALLGLAGARVAVTSLSLPLMQQCFARQFAPRN